MWRRRHTSVRAHAPLLSLLLLLLLVVCALLAAATAAEGATRSAFAGLFVDDDEVECVNGGEVDTSAHAPQQPCVCPIYYTGTRCEQRQCPHSVTGHGPDRIAPVNPATMRCDHCEAGVYDGMNCQLCQRHTACDATRGQQCNQSLVVHGTSKQFECSLDSPYFLRLMGDDRNITAQILINCTTADGAVFRDKDNGVCHMAIYRVEPEKSYVDPFFRCDTTACSMRRGVVDKGDDSDDDDSNDSDDDDDDDDDSGGGGGGRRGGGSARRRRRARVVRVVRVAGQVTLVALCASLAVVGAASSSSLATTATMARLGGRKCLRRVMLTLASTIAVTALVYVCVMIVAMQSQPAVATVVYECQHTRCACAEDPPSMYQPICSQSDVLARSILPSILNKVRIECVLGTDACQLTLADISLVFDATCRASECVNTTAYPYWPPESNHNDASDDATHRAQRRIVALLFALGLLSCVGVVAHCVLTRWRSRYLADEFVVHFRLPHSTFAMTDDDDDDDDHGGGRDGALRSDDNEDSSFDSDVGGLSPAVLPIVTNNNNNNAATAATAGGDERQPLLSRSHTTRNGSDASAWVANARAQSHATAASRHTSASQAQHSHNNNDSNNNNNNNDNTRHSDASYVSDSMQRRVEARLRQQPASREVTSKMAQLRRIARAPLELRAQSLQYSLCSGVAPVATSPSRSRRPALDDDNDNGRRRHCAATATDGGAAAVVVARAQQQHNNNNTRHGDDDDDDDADNDNNDDGAGRRVILHAVNFTVRSGEVLAIMGPSGAGKTTLLDLLAARAKAGVVGGTVYLNGTPVTTNTSACAVHARTAATNAAATTAAAVVDATRTSGEQAAAAAPQQPQQPQQQHRHYTFGRGKPGQQAASLAAAYTGLIGYVSQEDTLLPALTVRQTIEYAARLKLPRAFSRKTVDRIVRQVIRVLRLQQCEHVLIGDGATIRGVSGGEKRRVSIAVELLANPRILCLDEPTSGLDAVSAQHIMEAVVALSRDSPMRAYAPHYFAFQPVVILSIHQPSRQIFAMFDKVLLLSRGIGVYCGPAATAAATLEQRLRSSSSSSSGVYGDDDMAASLPSCSEHDNPAEYLMKLEERLDHRMRRELLVVETTAQPSPALAPMRRVADAHNNNNDNDNNVGMAAPVGATRLGAAAVATTARRLRYSDALPPASTSSMADDDDNDDVGDYVDGACVLRVSGEFRRYYANVYQQLGLLTSRSATCLLTSSHLVVCHAAVVACLASLMCFLYPTQALDLPGSLNRAGSVTFLLLVTAFVSLSTLEQLVTERKLFVLERENGFYSTLPYLLSKVVVDLLPLRVVPAVVLSSVIYFPMGFRVDHGVHFFWFILVTVLFSVSMTLIVMCIGVLSSTFGSAVLLSSVCILWNFVFGGSMVQAETIPRYLRPSKSLSPFFLAFESLMVNELDGQACVFSPTDETGKPSSASIPIMCVQYLANVGLKPARFSTDVMQLALYCFVFLLLAWLLLATCTRIIR